MEAVRRTVAGGESAFLAFNDPSQPRHSFGTTVQGFIDMHDRKTGMSRDIKAHPGMHLGMNPEDKRYRFNWNGPLIHNQVNPQVLYHGGNVLLRSEDRRAKGNLWLWITSTRSQNAGRLRHR